MSVSQFVFIEYATLVLNIVKTYTLIRYMQWSVGLLHNNLIEINMHNCSDQISVLAYNLTFKIYSKKLR